MHCCVFYDRISKVFLQLLDQLLAVIKSSEDNMLLTASLELLATILASPSEKLARMLNDEENRAVQLHLNAFRGCERMRKISSVFPLRAKRNKCISASSAANLSLNDSQIEPSIGDQSMLMDDPEPLFQASPEPCEEQVKV